MKEETPTIKDDDAVDTEAAHEWANAQDWQPSEAEDKGNPRNWSRLKKLYHVAIPVCIAFLCPFGSSVYTPGLKQIMSQFGVSREIALLPFVFYLLGLSFGPVIAAPTSETFGRRVVYLAALPSFAVFTLGAGFSNNITALTICRFFAGMSSSPGLSVGSGTVADLFVVAERGVPVMVFVTSVQFGPALGPLVGGFVTEKENWRWTQWAMLFGVAIVFLITIGMSETYKKSILEARAKKLGIKGPPQRQLSRVGTFKFFATNTVTRPIRMLLTEPIVTFLDVYVAFTFGLLNAFFPAFPLVFRSQYHFDLGSIGLTYLGQTAGSAIGLIIELCTYHFYWKRIGQATKEQGSTTKQGPEKWLFTAKIGAILLPISLFWFGWTARPSIHWIVPVIAEGFFACGNLLVFTCALLFLQECYGAQYGASASASNTFLRYLAAFAFPLFAVQMFEALGTGWATSLLGFVAVLLMPIPFVLERYSARLRAKSKYVPSY